jgi:hypothetical protein
MSRYLANPTRRESAVGVLSNHRHEKYCQELQKLLAEGVKLGEARTEAYRRAGFSSAETCIGPNSRKLAQTKAIKARMAELAEYTAKLSGIESGWFMLRLKEFADGVADFEQVEIKRMPNEAGDLVVAEHKTKIRQYDPIAAMRLMAEIGGYKAPAKTAFTSPDGKDPAKLTLEGLVAASYEQPNAEDPKQEPSE